MDRGTARRPQCKVDRGFTETKAEMREGFSRLEARMDRMDARTTEKLGELDGRTSEKFGELEGRMESMEERTETGFAELNQRFDRLQQTLIGPPSPSSSQSSAATPSKARQAPNLGVYARR